VRKTFSAEQRQRYSRHWLVPEIGEAGQAKPLASKVPPVGAGGLGSPAVCTRPPASARSVRRFDASTWNLQRQVLHTNARGRPKTESAAETLRA
jgi:molybdopterin/thiamine biosynthesis adenylyltransferase